jgi:hypothetical protein
VRADLLRFVLEAGRPVELVTWQEASGAEGRRILADCRFRPVDAAQTKRGLPSILVWPVAPDADPARLSLGNRSLLDPASWDLRLADTSYA